MPHVLDVGLGALHEQLVEAVGLGGSGSPQVIGAVAVLVIGQQGELGHHQQLSVDVLHRLVHLAVLVLENAELDGLLEHPVQILFGVPRGDTQKNEQAVAAGADFFPVHVDRGGGNALNDSFHSGISFLTRSLWSRPEYSSARGDGTRWSCNAPRSYS